MAGSPGNISPARLYDGERYAAASQTLGKVSGRCASPASQLRPVALRDAATASALLPRPLVFPPPSAVPAIAIVPSASKRAQVSGHSGRFRSGSSADQSIHAASAAASRAIETMSLIVQPLALCPAGGIRAAARPVAMW